MAVTRILTQTRPNTGVAFHNASDEFKAFMQEWVDAGTLVHNGGSNDESGLIRTWSLTFPDETSFASFNSDTIHQTYTQHRREYNIQNNIPEEGETTA